jgi:purine-binding chemotaxis protein CheW
MSGNTTNVNSKHNISEDNRYLVFSLGNEQFAIPLLRVKEVIASTDTRPVPHSPTHFKGLLDLRGVVISVIDLRIKMKAAKRENSAETSIIILDHKTEPIGVIVDSVDYVANLQPNEINTPPTIHGGTGSDFITGVFSKEKKMILLLDIMASLGAEDMKLIKRNAQAA